MHLLRSPRDQVLALSRAIAEVGQQTTDCPICHNLVLANACEICSDPTRDFAQVCVVEEPKDLLAIEKTGRFRGGYHVLRGRLAPLEGRIAKDLTLDALEARLASGAVRELILATNPDLEGDATALAVAELADAHGVRVTRLARGLPTGSSLEHSSAAMLGDALMARQELPRS